MPAGGAHPRLAGKVPRCRPDRFTSASSSVWVDASFRVLDSRFADLARAQLRSHELVVSVHPESVDGPGWGAARNCLYDEADFSSSRRKYLNEPVIAQAEHYLSRGMPREWGLWALGIIARRHSRSNRELGLAWLQEIESWTVQDQVSFPYLLWRRDRRPGEWPFQLLQNDLIQLKKHLGKD